MRTIFRLILWSSSLLALVTMGISLWRLGPTDSSAWATVAAALAVIAAVASAWTGQRVLELQEDARAQSSPHHRCPQPLPARAVSHHESRRWIGAPSENHMAAAAPGCGRERGSTRA